MLLDGLRVLDLTDIKGLLCGRILGDIGADVIKVEKPGGDECRMAGPFFGNNPDREKSLYWFALNANKRGVTLDLGTPMGRDIFLKLVRRADVVVESFPPDHLRQAGLGYEALKKLNPQLIMASITPFGQTGPYRGFKGSDLVAMAMSGLMYLNGDADRPPVRITVPQSYIAAGSQAALGVTIAYYHRELTGRGQHVDVSLQASLLPFLQNAPLSWDISRVNLKRMGQFRALSGMAATQRFIWTCLDGEVVFGIYGGQLGESTNRELVQWMDREGLAPDSLKAIDWSKFDVNRVTQEEFLEFEKAIARFFARHTRAELYAEALKRDMMLYPVATTADIVNDPQLEARGFWVKVSHGSLGDITYPGPFVKMSETPCTVRRRAPMIGEHNQEVYVGELRLSPNELNSLREAGVI